ncbi:larval cuticle protein F1-like isoform X2 [Plodia interpunctella]|uniref:larval cuticle protein F1-like isoform X2 n=1 Tax=Plodia interpunctella TaxID=58824 RepID=UPI002367CF42|nr:larval cuticle protein F1-like isoform X2 [Plodia interpunctella]
MKVVPVIVGILVACAVTLAAEHGPLLTALQPQDQQVVVLHPQVREKRHLALGALGIGALGAGLLGAGVLGAGALGAGVLGAKALGAGVVGGALASSALSGRSYGGYYGGGYSSYGGSYGYPSSYIVEEDWY